MVKSQPLFQAGQQQDILFGLLSIILLAPVRMISISQRLSFSKDNLAVTHLGLNQVESTDRGDELGVLYHENKPTLGSLQHFRCAHAILDPKYWRFESAVGRINISIKTLLAKRAANINEDHYYELVVHYCSYAAPIPRMLRRGLSLRFSNEPDRYGYTQLAPSIFSLQGSPARGSTFPTLPSQ